MRPGKFLEKWLQRYEKEGTGSKTPGATLHTKNVVNVGECLTYDYVFATIMS